MLNSAEHEIFSANKYENANNSWHFSYVLAEKISCSAMFSNKAFAIVSYLRFISMTNFMLSWVEHEKIFIISGPENINYTLVKNGETSYGRNKTLPPAEVNVGI